MRLRNKFTEWFWFILLILPLCVTFIYGFKNSSIGLEYGSLLTCLNSFLPFSNQLYNAFEGALSFLGVGSEFSVVLAYVCYFVFLQFLRICTEFILLLVEVAQHLIDKACLR
jgi:hypothetical protein